MKEFLININEFCNKPVVIVISSIIILVMGINILYRTYKVLKQPDVDLYSKQSLQDICFSLDCAIDGYRNNFSDEECFCNADYVRLVSLHKKICKLLGENPDGSKIKK